MSAPTSSMKGLSRDIPSPLEGNRSSPACSGARQLRRAGRCGCGPAADRPVAQVGIEDAFGKQLVDVADALVARPLEFLQRDAGGAIGLIELFGALLRVPLRLEGRQMALDLLEAD